MVRAYVVYALLVAISLALVCCGIALFQRGDRKERVGLVRRVTGALATAFGVVLLILDLNVLPTWLRQAGVLHTTGVVRSADCAQPTRPDTIVDAASGNEPFAGRHCSVEWVANVSQSPASATLPLAGDVRCSRSRDAPCCPVLQPRDDRVRRARPRD